MIMIFSHFFILVTFVGDSIALARDCRGLDILSNSVSDSQKNLTSETMKEQYDNVVGELISSPNSWVVMDLLRKTVFAVSGSCVIFDKPFAISCAI